LIFLQHKVQIVKLLNATNTETSVTSSDITDSKVKSQIVKLTITIACLSSFRPLYDSDNVTGQQCLTVPDIAAD